MSTKIAKKRLVGCKDRGEKILNILNGKKGSVDVMEFANTIKFVISVFEDYVKSKDKDRPQIHDDGARIEQLLKDYEELLVQLVNTGRFLRFFTSNRVRKNLDNINSQLHKEVSQIFLDLQSNRRKSMNKRGTRTNLLKSELAKEKQSECIKDDDGKALWENSFGQTLMVDWQKFIQALRTVLNINDEMEKQLRYILDNSNTSFVSMFKFADFLNGFGPLKQCIEKVMSVLNADWFHGFLSSTEAERLLERQAPGTYLIRFSKSKAGSFAIAYVDANQKNAVTHTLITCCPPSGFKIEEAYNRNARGRLFVTLQEVVEFYGYILKAPFKSDLSRQSWFHGDLTSQESEEILAGASIGTFLFRFSSKPGFLAVSYVAEGEVKHGLLECLPGGYKYDNRPPIYATLQDVVTNLSDLLKTPVTSLTFESGKKTDFVKHIAQQASPETGGLVKESTYSNFSSLAARSASPPQSPAQLRHPPSAIAQAPNVVRVSVGPTPGLGQYGSVARMSVNMQQSSEYGGMPSPSTEEYGGMPSSTDEYGGMPSSSTEEYGGMPSSTDEYGGMPSSSTEEYGGMPSTNTSQYGKIGSIPSPSANASRVTSQYGKIGNVQPPPSSPPQGRVVSQQYGKIIAPSSTPVTAPQNTSQYGKIGTINSPATPAPATSTPQGQYGKMPQGLSSSSLVAQPATSTPQGQYGKMPQGLSSATPTPLTSAPQGQGQYGKMPQGLASVASVSQTQLPTATPQGQYGRMPQGLSMPQSSVPSSVPQAPVDGNYGAIPSPANRSSVILPSTPPSTPPTTHLPTLTPATAPQGQYGRMPQGLSMPQSSVPSSVPQGSTDGNYGAIPSPASRVASMNLSQGIAKTSLPLGSTSPPAVGNYGAIPSPRVGSVNLSGPSVPQGQGGQYGKMPTALANTAPVQQQPVSQYGKMPGTLPPSQTSPSINYGRMPTALPNAQQQQPPQQQYGRMPSSSQLQSHAHEYDGLPSNANDDYGAMPVTSEYGSMPTSGNEYGSMPTGPADDDYGSLPLSSPGQHRQGNA